MSEIVSDFFKLGSLRLFSRIIMGLRGLFIVTVLGPSDLGEYTIWLLLVFYFTLFEFGILNGLERDIPHYRGKEDLEEIKRISDVGWSAFFGLAFISSLLLGVTSFWMFKHKVLALLLTMFLLTDKFYRAYDAGSRINFQYQDNGLAELLYAIVSFMFIGLFLPRFGAYYIFAGFIIAAVCSTYFLYRKCPLNFHWRFDIRSSFRYIKGSVPLAMVFYFIEIFHFVSLTILAFIWDKTTLGYFAFAFRIFQILLTVFPLVIREVMRTRMYFTIAQTEDHDTHLEQLFFPMTIYSLITSVFWLAVYWWVDWGIGLIAPIYSASGTALKLLTLALLPIGVTTICSDYLCSVYHKKTKVVILAWGTGIILQICCLSLLGVQAGHVFYIVPVYYLVATLLVYVLVWRILFKVRGGNLGSSYARMVDLLLPLGIVCGIVYVMHHFIYLVPSKNFWGNLMPFGVSVAVLLVFVFVAAPMAAYKKLFDDLGVRK
jgi:O-antigen/teichoic acid export membrane protein